MMKSISKIMLEKLRMTSEPDLRQISPLRQRFQAVSFH